MASAHAHDHHHGHGHGAGDRGLRIALGLTLAIFAAELAGALASGSLALLADAGHLLADVAALALALGAAWMARRPASGRRTFGFKRAEILAALANGIALGVIAVGIALEAARRLTSPPDVAAGITLVVACGALLTNLASSAVLARSGGGLNVRAALRHVLADALSAGGVIVAAVVMLATGWRYADPIAGLAIAALVLWSGVAIVRESVDVLMEAAPEGIDIEVLGRSMAAVDGVVEVHDLHAWTVTSGFAAVAAHVTVAADAEPSMVRRRMAELLRNHFGIEHSTLQVERAGDESRLLQIRPRDVRRA